MASHGIEVQIFLEFLGKIKNSMTKETQTKATEDSIRESYSSIHIPSDMTQKLVYSYLVHSCYLETSESLGSALHLINPSKENSKEPNNKKAFSNIDASDMMEIDHAHVGGLIGTQKAYLNSLSNPLSSLQVRKQLYQFILDGNVNNALSLYSEKFNMFINEKKKENTEILFILHCQEFIEHVRVDSVRALEYAQTSIFFFNSKI